MDAGARPHRPARAAARRQRVSGVRGRIVLISLSRELGGAELHVERLAAYLARELDDTIELICRPDQALDPWCRRLEAAGVRVHRVAPTPSGLARLVRILRGTRLVHLHLAHPAGKYQVAAALSARLLRRPAVMTHHLAPAGQIPSPSGRGQVGGSWSSAYALYRRLFTRHIAISKFAKDLLIGRYGFDARRVAVIYNGTDPDVFTPAAADQRAALRRQLIGELTAAPVATDPVLIVTVARLSPQKGLMDLIDAAKQLTADLPSARYVVLGDGESRPTLMAAVSQAGLDQVVLLAGRRTPAVVADWLRAADLFVLPSHFEGGPAMALMEAMACGCAVIATSVSGTDELIADAQTGSLVPAGQPAALATAIRDLVRDAGRRSRMGQRARERVTSGFDIRQSHAQTLELYRAMWTAR